MYNDQDSGAIVQIRFATDILARYFIHNVWPNRSRTQYNFSAEVDPKQL